MNKQKVLKNVTIPILFLLIISTVIISPIKSRINRNRSYPIFIENTTEEYLYEGSSPEEYVYEDATEAPNQFEEGIFEIYVGPISLDKLTHKEYIYFEENASFMILDITVDIGSVDIAVLDQNGEIVANYENISNDAVFNVSLNDQDVLKETYVVVAKKSVIIDNRYDDDDTFEGYYTIKWGQE